MNQSNELSQYNLSEFCSPFFKDTGMCYADYMCYDTETNTFKGMTTNNEWVDFCRRAKYPLCLSFKGSGYHLWEGYYLDKIIHAARLNFNYAHFISIFRKKNNYVELFNFGSTPSHRHILSLYTNRLDLLDKFCDTITANAEHLLRFSENHTIIALPNHNLITKINDDLPVEKLRTNKALTNREIDCIKNLILGMTMKEMSKKLNLSPRTIEFYINNIKKKLACTRRSDIIKSYICQYGVDTISNLIE